MFKIKSETVLSICLPWPPSVNHYWGQRVVGKRAIRYIGAKGKAFREMVEHIAQEHLEHCKEHYSKGTRLAVCVQISPPDRRRRDIDNLCKALLDALEHAGVYPDDTQIDSLTLLRDIDDIVKGGMVKVTIGTIDKEDKDVTKKDTKERS